MSKKYVKSQWFVSGLDSANGQEKLQKSMTEKNRKVTTLFEYFEFEALILTDFSYIFS